MYKIIEIDCLRFDICKKCYSYFVFLCGGVYLFGNILRIDCYRYNVKIVGVDYE